MAYSIMADSKSDDEIDQLDYSLGMRTDPAEEALADLRRHQEEMGMAFDDAPVAAPDGDGLPIWMTHDEEVR